MSNNRPVKYEALIKQYLSLINPGQKWWNAEEEKLKLTSLSTCRICLIQCQYYKKKKLFPVASFQHDLLTFSMVFSVDVIFKQHWKARSYLVVIVEI